MGSSTVLRKMIKKLTQIIVILMHWIGKRHDSDKIEVRYLLLVRPCDVLSD